VFGDVFAAVAKEDTSEISAFAGFASGNWQLKVKYPVLKNPAGNKFLKLCILTY